MIKLKIKNNKNLVSTVCPSLSGFWKNSRQRSRHQTFTCVIRHFSFLRKQRHAKFGNRQQNPEDGKHKRTEKRKDARQQYIKVSQAIRRTGWGHQKFY